jgi:hypothetical protein
MCYEPLTLLSLSVILNILLGLSYIRLSGKYQEAHKLAEDMVKLLKRAGKIK